MVPSERRETESGFRELVQKFLTRQQDCAIEYKGSVTGLRELRSFHECTIVRFRTDSTNF